MSVITGNVPDLRLDDPRRRSVFLKQSNFTKKNGRAHHAFDKMKAPYPTSFDRRTLDLDVIDHIFLKSLKQSVSFVQFKDGPPKRCLDLGCGTGAWILDALKEWRDCHFVGFDLVNIQPPLHLLGPSSSRVQWVHGNFLTTKLPFEDDEFDHVHIRGIARAVPENKWDNLFGEVSRVLRPGGSVEMIEDGNGSFYYDSRASLICAFTKPDILFPSLPRWYTRALRARDQRPTIHRPDGSSRRSLPMSPPPTPPRDDAPHDHKLLESLFSSVFETRFINREPTSILPSYFATYFRQVQCSPAIKFPTPTLPNVPTYNIASSGRFSSPPTLASAARSLRAHRKQESYSSTDSSASNSKNLSDDEDDEELFQQRTPPSTDDELRPLSKEDGTPCVTPYYSTHASTCDAAELGLLPLSALSDVTCFSLAFQLHRTFNLVLACQESMWEVLNDRIRNREAELKELGWDDDEIEGEHARQRFDKLLERYQGDMQTRAALWQRMALSQSPNFKLPKQGLMTKAEMNDEDRVYHAVLNAQRHASTEELRTPCRTMRIFIGYKSGM
ncbi:S-adenosyl-L-methionine-dependent methyltransferase [Fomitiporia mediterranea MF3/22]|uniref:S-adenosyl-L-methionine-dependent methyltransferase n=1 Tax=Fomitiporia mediterranea (strain MF3/22) TaxID=694068 RepID=UPI0004409199|nr:S-adenosyl-L-methionine-dependent methyltransferase [Fomitiporia mediterranea MF3/22]EJD03821.1 S-adenosyl-L-methionine-dependent methyltransferase [Fomitiporia mediterranea MF3/22]